MMKYFGEVTGVEYPLNMLAPVFLSCYIQVALDKIVSRSTPYKCTLHTYRT